MSSWRAGHDVKKNISISDNQGFTKNTCANFHNKILNGYLEKICTYAKIGPKIPQNYPQQRKAWCKKFFECSVHQVYTKNICTKFHEKILNSYEVLDKHCQKWAQKYPPIAPQEGHDMEKSSAMTQKGKPRTSVQDFTEHIERFSKSRRNVPK